MMDTNLVTNINYTFLGSVTDKEWKSHYFSQKGVLKKLSDYLIPFSFHIDDLKAKVQVLKATKRHF